MDDRHQSKTVSPEAKATWTSNGIQLAIIIGAFLYGYGVLHTEVADTREDVKEIKLILRQKGFIAQNSETNIFAAGN